VAPQSPTPPSQDADARLMIRLDDATLLYGGTRCRPKSVNMIFPAPFEDLDNLTSTAFYVPDPLTAPRAPGAKPSSKVQLMPLSESQFLIQDDFTIAPPIGQWIPLESKTGSSAVASVILSGVEGTAFPVIYLSCRKGFCTAAAATGGEEAQAGGEPQHYKLHMLFKVGVLARDVNMAPPPGAQQDILTGQCAISLDRIMQMREKALAEMHHHAPDGSHSPTRRPHLQLTAPMTNEGLPLFYTDPTTGGRYQMQLRVTVTVLSA
jgi:hypothetical protein